MDDLALSRVRRWQGATIGLILLATAAQVATLVRARTAPPPGAGGLDRAAVERLIQEEAARRPDPSAALGARLDEKEQGLSARIDALEKSAASRMDALETALGSRPAPAAALAGARVVRCEGRTLVRFRTGDAGRLEWRSLALGGPEAGPFPSGEDEAGARWTAAPAGEPLVKVPLPPPAPPLESGVLFVEAIVRAEKDVGEDAGAPHRLWLACVEPGERRQLWDLVGQFTPAKGATRDALLKVAANTAALAVSPDARVELWVDADALARRLAGTLDVYVRTGPLIAVPEGGKKP